MPQGKADTHVFRGKEWQGRIMPQILYHNLSCEWIKNVSNPKIFDFWNFYQFENSKFWNYYFESYFQMKFFGDKREIWSQDKPLVDENSKGWNGKEFDSEVVGKSIRKLFHQMSAEKRFVTFIIFRKFFENFDNFDDCAAICALKSVKSRLWDFLIFIIPTKWLCWYYNNSIVKTNDRPLDTSVDNFLSPFIKIEFTIVIY